MTVAMAMAMIKSACLGSMIVLSATYFGSKGWKVHNKI
jgi:hypothetical protein